MKNIVALLSLFLLLPGCAAYGPVDSPEFDSYLASVLPTDDRTVLLQGAGEWVPNTRGFTDIQSSFISSPTDPIPGALVITDRTIYVAQWDDSSSKFQIMKKFDFSQLGSVDLYEYGLNRRVTVQLKDFTTHSFRFVTGNSGYLDKEKTVRLAQILKAEIGV